MKRDVLRMLRGCAVAACGFLTTGCASTQFTTETPTRQDQIKVESLMSWSSCLSPFSNYSLDHPEKWNTLPPAGLACPTP